jgi:SAM-dependent methyltransferase
LQGRFEHWRGRWKERVSARRRKQSPAISESEYRAYRTVHPFDEQYGVDTSGLLYDLETGHANDTCNNGYFGVAPSIFHRILERLALDYGRYTFVDLGSGKGRALLLASGYPFREVIGVEISPALHRIAVRNIARYQRKQVTRSKMQAVQADAADFRWPSGPLLVYMWNAFTEPVMRRVLENLRAAHASTPREIYLVYVHPELEILVEDAAWLERIWVGEIMMSEEDYAAWAFPVRSEFCAVYRAVRAEASPENSHV